MAKIVIMLTLLVLLSAAKAEELRDPTQPLYSGKVQEEKKTALVLQAIYKRSGGNVAVINGEVARVGDMVDGARLVNISAVTVSVEESGKATTLYLRPSIR